VETASGERRLLEVKCPPGLAGKQIREKVKYFGGDGQLKNTHPYYTQVNNSIGEVIYNFFSVVLL